MNNCFLRRSDAPRITWPRRLDQLADVPLKPPHIACAIDKPYWVLSRSSLIEDQRQADQRVVDELDLDDLPVVLDDDVHVGIKFGSSDGNLEAVRGYAAGEFSAPVAAQLPPCAFD